MAVQIRMQESASQRLRRLEALLTPDSVPCDETTTQKLLVAAEQGDVDKFIEVVESYRSEVGRLLCPRVVLSPSRNSLLHVAAGLERDEILRAIVSYFDDLLASGNCRKDTALHLAARAGRAPAARVLINRASDVETRRALVQAKNGRENTPLHEAVMNGHREVVEILISEDLQPIYWQNKEGKCPISLAVETGNLEVLRLLLAVPLDLPRIQGVSPVHVAVLHGKLDMLMAIFKKNRGLFGLKHDRRGTPLHLAAFVDYCDGIRFIRERFPSSAVEYDRDGNFPIHVACKEGNVKAITELLRQGPNPSELINQHGQNILHVCAKHGRISAVKYILANVDLEKLINERDDDGNTPLHLATLPWKPLVLLRLLWVGRIDLKLVNNECLTALDVAVEQSKSRDSRLRKRLPSFILRSAGAPTSKDLAMSKPRDRKILEEMTIQALQKEGVLQKQVETRMLVATLVATITFAAGLQVPGGFADKPEPDARGAPPAPAPAPAALPAGMAQLLYRSMFDAFVISNTVAMYSAIGAVLIWPWTQLDDSYVALSAHLAALLALLVSLGTMSAAFMAGSYVILSKLTWLASLVLLLGAGALFCICLLFLAMYVPLGMGNPYFRPITFYIICLGICISTSLFPFPDVMEDEDSEDEDSEPAIME